VREHSTRHDPGVERGVGEVAFRKERQEGSGMIGKASIWTMAVALILSAWGSAAGTAFDLTKLSSICIEVEELSHEARQDLGLEKEAIGKYVYVLLKAKVPRLGVIQGYIKDCPPQMPALYVVVSLGVGEIGGRKTDYYGEVGAFLTRRAVWESGNRGLGIAYYHGVMITGPLRAAREAINSALDRLLTDFAAEYYKAGNP
jgi:hypothetical protein